MNAPRAVGRAPVPGNPETGVEPGDEAPQAEAPADRETLAPADTDSGEPPAPEIDAGPGDTPEDDPEPTVAEQPEPRTQPRPEWWRHDNERWIVGDAGRQPEVVPLPSTAIAATRPDTVVDGGRVGGLDFRATSTRGLGHQQAGTPRQDAYLVRPSRDGRWLVGCVADGVSEGRRSHEAADLVCHTVSRVLLDGLAATRPEDLGDWQSAVERLPWQEAVDAASAAVVRAAHAAMQAVYRRRGDVESLASLEDAPLPEAAARTVMSSTAVAFLVSTAADSTGGHPFALTVAAGDSSALRLAAGAWHPLSEVKNAGADIASSAVRPLPRAVRTQPTSGVLRPGEALAVITDGLGDPMGAGQGVVGRFLADRWRTPPDLLAFAQHVAFYRRTFTDDRTAVVVWVDADR
ncbi:protein phosphatase 2C domain-containing protein [Longispora sp. NPDC051575]|uniref:protein phosphatase 2C domain-containing protein n=1 Tax=Longispora sp. NPDC051575 TaxID=3154943 RepID=UPI0034344403